MIIRLIAVVFISFGASLFMPDSMQAWGLSMFTMGILAGLDAIFVCERSVK